MTIGSESSSPLPPTSAKADLNVLDLEGGRDWRPMTVDLPVVEAAGCVIRIVIDGAPLFVALALALTPGVLPGDLRLAKRPANAERAAADGTGATVTGAVIGLLLPMADDNTRAEPPPLAPAPPSSDTNISRTPTMPLPG